MGGNATAGIKAVHQRILVDSVFFQREESAISLHRDWWSQIIITFIKSQPLSTCLSIFCMRMWEDAIIPFYTCSRSLVFSRKDTCTNNWSCNLIWNSFFPGLPFVFKRTNENYSPSDVIAKWSQKLSECVTEKHS